MEKAIIVSKGWGAEIIFAPMPEYCGKLLCFNKGAKSSMHYHLMKKESWYVQSGVLIYRYINPVTAETSEKKLYHGSVVHIEPGSPHQLEAVEESTIFEVSTHDDPNDNYRIAPGDSQKSNS